MTIKEYAKNKGVRMWQIAEYLKINESTFSKSLRHPPSETRRAELIAVIDKLATARNA